MLYAEKNVLGRLAPRVTEAKKSHNLLSANRKSKKAHNIIQTQTLTLATREADEVHLSLGLKTREPGAVIFEAEVGHPGSRSWTLPTLAS